MMSRAVPWLLAALLGASCVCVIIYAVHQESDRAAVVSRETEASRLRKANIKGVVLVEQRRAKDLEDELSKAMDENSELSAAVERSRKASPGARPVSVGQGSTRAPG